MNSQQYDPAARRRAQRAGRQRGCSIYIPVDELEKAGIDPDGPPPLYRVWGTKGGGLMVRLYADTGAPQDSVRRASHHDRNGTDNEGAATAAPHA